ncbi:MAG: glycosyltransferase family 4 protein [Nitrospinota bacterium]
MKVALIRQAIRAGAGGAAGTVLGWARTLLEAGHEVHLISQTIEEADLPPDAVAHRLRSPRGLSLVRAAGFARAVSWFLLRHRGQFDIVHSFDRTLGQDIYRAGDGCHREWLAQRARAESPWKNFCVTVNPLHRYYLSIERKLFATTPLIIANAEQGRQEILRHYGVAPERVRVIYTGVDRDRFRPANRDLFRATVRQEVGAPATSPLVLFVGGGFKRKGLAAMIHAVADLGSEDVWLAVAGRDDPGPYQRQSAERGVADRVVFLGERADVEALYGAADVFCLPTLYDPCSNACLEALASGLPVVTSAANGASEAIVEGANGLVLNDPLDRAAVAQAVRRALDLDPAAVFEVSERMLRPFDWDEHRRAMLACYEEVLAQRNESRVAA